MLDFATALERLPGRPVWRRLGQRVALQQSCHLVNGMGQGAASQRGAQRAAGEQWVPLAGQESCCGSAGVYNFVQPAMAWAILSRHLEEAAATGTERWLTNNPGCTQYLTYGVARTGLPVRVQHLADYLYES